MKSNMRFATMVIWMSLIVLWAGCAQVDTTRESVFDPQEDSGDADFSVVVALGNSLTAGYQSLGLSESHQRMSYAALVARQMGKTVFSSGTMTGSVGDFVLPGVSDPGTPGTLQLVSLVPLEIEPVQNPGNPVNTQYPAPYNNLAVPGADAADVLNTVTSNTNPSFDLVLRGQGTMIQQAGALNPTFVILWIGSNDVLKKVTVNEPITPLAQFEQEYRTIVETILSFPSSPDMAVANIPQVFSIPFTTTIPPFVVNPATREPVLVNGQLVPLIGPDGPLDIQGTSTNIGDLVTLGAQDLLAMGIGIPAALGGTGQPLPDAVVLNEAEIIELITAVNAMNDVIEEVAGENGIPVVNISLLLARITTGIEVGGVEFNSEFITGGAFSLDGIHPTDLTQALAANEFIRAINRTYGSSIPLVDLAPFAHTEASSSPLAVPLY